MRFFTSEIVKFARQAIRAEDKPISLLLFAAGVVITLFQYWDYLETKKVAVSYQHVQEWEKSGYQRSFNKISKIIRTSEAATLETLPDDFTEAQIDLAQLNVAQRLLVEDADGIVGRDIDRLIYFFDKLSVCVDQKLCDADLLDLFFKDNLTRFWIYSSSFVAKRREEISGYGELTETYQAALQEDDNF